MIAKSIVCRSAQQVYAGFLDVEQSAGGSATNLAIGQRESIVIGVCNQWRRIEKTHGRALPNRRRQEGRSSVFPNRFLETPFRRWQDIARLFYVCACPSSCDSIATKVHRRFDVGKVRKVNEAVRVKAGIASVVIGLACPSLGACAMTTSVPVADTPADLGTVVTVRASDNACDVSGAEAKAGLSTFVVTNDGTKVSEFYVYGPGDRVLGSLVNLSPGLQRKLSVQLNEPGRYQTECRPGVIGAGQRAAFTVTGDDVGVATNPFADAADGYKRYLGSQTAALVASTAAFVGAIKKGDVVGAEALYPTTHGYYERIKPAAVSFPDNLDSRIDGLEAGVQPGAGWTGFHRLEKDLWASGLQPDTDAVADRLLADVKALDADVEAPTWTIDLSRIAGTVRDLLEGVGAKMISGASEPYSHNDLWDFQSNIDGAQAAVASLRPILDQRNPDLGQQVDAQFSAVDQLLSTHRDGDGFVFYDKVAASERQVLASAVVALSGIVGRVQTSISG